MVADDYKNDIAPVEDPIIPKYVIVGYDENGVPNCRCDNGKIYTNCGSNCECCNQLLHTGKLSDIPPFSVTLYGESAEHHEKNREIDKNEIRSVIASVEENLVKSKGERARVTVVGYKGSKLNLTIKNSDDCSILKDEIEHVEIPSSGVYTIYVDFPAIAPRKTEEIYSIQVTPEPPCILSLDMISQLPIKLYQYPMPTVTFTDKTSETGPTLSVARNPSTATFTGPTRTFAELIPGHSSTTQTLTITEGASTAGFFYVKENPKFNDNITTSTHFKKIIQRDDYCTNCISTETLKLQTATDGSDGTTVTRSDTDTIKVGMAANGTVTKTKEVANSLDEKTGEILTDDCNKLTNRFRFLGARATDDLFLGMLVSGKGFENVHIVSIDCETDITLSSKLEIRNGVILTFSYTANFGVTEVISAIGSDGDTTVLISPATILPHDTAVTFDEDETIVHGSMTHSGSGTDSIVLTNTLDVTKFGKKDVTYTLDLDNFITRKPNSKDRYFTIEKDSTSKNIKIIPDEFDTDSNATTKTISVTKNPSNGLHTITSGSEGTRQAYINYTPNTGFVGEDTIKFQLSDGTNSSDEKTIYIKIN